MRKGGPSDMREETFKATTKGKEKEESGYVSEAEEENFVKKLQVGVGRFRGKLPFKFFCCGRFGHYVVKCPYRENQGKGKEYEKINRKRFEKKRSFYTHEDNDGISNGEGGESDQDCHLLMEFQSNNEFDGIEENGTFIENFDRNISEVVTVIDVSKYSSIGETRALSYVITTIYSM